MAGRPPTSVRLGTAARGAQYGRVGTAAAPGTASSRGGIAGPGALNSQIKVPDRPMTQQGLGGMTSIQKGPGRAIQDESFFLGILRGKVTELTTEISRLKEEIQGHERDHSSFTSYEKRAQGISSELKELEGKLKDLNVLQENLNTGVSTEETLTSQLELKSRNVAEAAEIDNIFAAVKKVEALIKKTETAIESEKGATSRLVEEMPAAQRAIYIKKDEEKKRYANDIVEKQAQLDRIGEEISHLEGELSRDPLKREAVILAEEIHLLELKRAGIVADLSKLKGTPEEQRNALLEQVKADNSAIANIERRITEVQNEIVTVEARLGEEQEEPDVDRDEKRAKYLELLKRDEEMQQFLDGFDNERAKEVQITEKLEGHIVALLERISQTLARGTQLPSVEEHQSMKDDLAFKSKEMERAQSTSESLSERKSRLQKDLVNVNQLEVNIGKEMSSLADKVLLMQKEVSTFSDLDKLRREMDHKKEALAIEKKRATARKELTKATIKDLAAKYEAEKVEIAANETYTQLLNLEKKCQNLEKNNFVIKDYIANKEMEANYKPLIETVMVMVKDYNSHLTATITAPAGKKN